MSAIADIWNGIPQAWGFIEPFVAALTFSFILRTWLRVRKSYIEVSESGSLGEPVVVDFHGDFNPASSQGDWATGYRVVKYPLQDIDLGSPEGFERDLMRRLEGFRKEHTDLFGRLRANDGQLVLTITGASSVLALWLPMLHGILGQFPKITYPVRHKEGGFVWSKPIDGQRIRLMSSEQFRAIVESVQPIKAHEPEKA